MKNIAKDISSGEFKKVYLIHGEEEYIKKNIKKQLKNAVAGDENSMNFNKFEGKDVKLKEVISIADTFPFFADKRLILLENTGCFKSGGDELTEYIETMPDTTIMVFVENEVDKRCRLYKTVKETGYVCEANHMSEAELSNWILKKIGKYHVIIGSTD